MMTYRLHLDFENEEALIGFTDLLLREMLGHKGTANLVQIGQRVDDVQTYAIQDGTDPCKFLLVRREEEQ